MSKTAILRRSTLIGLVSCFFIGENMRCYFLKLKDNDPPVNKVLTVLYHDDWYASKNPEMFKAKFDGTDWWHVEKNTKLYHNPGSPRENLSWRVEDN